MANQSATSRRSEINMAKPPKATKQAAIAAIYGQGGAR